MHFDVCALLLLSLQNLEYAQTPDVLNEYSSTLAKCFWNEIKSDKFALNHWYFDGSLLAFFIDVYMFFLAF